MVGSQPWGDVASLREKPIVKELAVPLRGCAERAYVCVKGEASVRNPGAQGGECVAGQQSSFMGLWGKAGGRAERDPPSLFSVQWHLGAGALRLP